MLYCNIDIANKLEIFKNEEFGEVRMVEENGKMMFCGSDVAKALGYNDTNQAIRKNCKSFQIYLDSYFCPPIC